MNLYLKFLMDVPFIKCVNVVLLEMKLILCAFQAASGYIVYILGYRR